MSNIYQNIAFISEHASPLADLGGVDTGGAECIRSAGCQLFKQRSL